MSNAQGQLETGRRGRSFRLGLVALCLLVYLPGFFTIPAVDRDESRFAQASRQMFESAALPAGERDAKHAGGLLMPMVQDRPRLNKPPMIYWLQAGAAAICTGGEPARDAIWMYRVPSLIAAVVAVLVTFEIGVSMFGAGVGALAAVMLAVCPVVAWEAHQARADMVLLAWTVGAMGAMWKVVETERRRDGETKWGWPLAFWVCVAGGVMTKGPITPMVAGLAVVCLCVVRREVRWVLALRPLVGVVIVAACVGPWVVAIAQRIGWGEYWSRVYDETIGRSLSSQEGHWGPPGYHLVLLPVLFWPGSLVTGFAVVRACRGSRGVDGGPLLFCLAWALPAWLVFEAIGTKLPHYTLPLYPALALISAWAIAAMSERRMSAPAGVGLMRWFWVLIGVVVCGLPVASWSQGVPGSVWMVPLLVVWLGAVGFWLYDAAGSSWSVAERWRAHQVAGVVAIAGTFPFLFGWILPRMERVWLTEGLVDVLRVVDPSGARPLAAVGYQEDSLVFRTRGRVERVDDSLDWWWKHPDGLVIMPFERASAADVKVLGDVSGFNYSKGRSQRLIVGEVAK